MLLRLGLLCLLVCLASCAPAGEAGDGGGGSDTPDPEKPEDPYDPRCGPLPQLEAPACDGAGWCWSHPRAVALDVRDGFVDANGAIWLAGAGADPLLWHEDAWTLLPLAGAARGHGLNRILSTQGIAWATDAGGLLRWSGASWLPVDTGPGLLDPADLWASGPEDLWVVGAGVRRWDGESWRTVPTRGGPFHGVFGLGPEQVWVAGAGGALLRWDGGEFQREDPGTRKNLRALWGTGPGDLWVVGDGGTLLHWNGGGWRHVPAPVGAAFTSVAGLARDEVLATGYDATSGKNLVIRWNGSSWSELPLPLEGRPRRLWSDPAGGRIWIGGDQGLLLSWDGACFRSGSEAPPASILALSPAGDWAVGERGTMLRRAGEAWSPVASTTDQHLRAVWSGEGVVFAVGDAGTLRRGDSEGMERIPFPVGDLRAVSGSGAADVWAGGTRGRLIHWDGVSLRQVPSPTRSAIRSLLAFPGEAWASAGGEAGELLRLRDGQWRLERATGGSPLLFGSGPTDLWLLSHLRGKAHLLERWEGEGWRVVPQGGPAEVMALAAESDDTWAVQRHGVLHHHDGATWTGAFIGTTEVIAMGAAEGELWLIDRGPAGDTLLHFQGATLLGSHEAPERLHAVWSGRAGEAWVAGAKGTLARWKNGGFESFETGTEADLHAVAGALEGEDVWAAGDGGVLLRFRNGSWEAFHSGTKVAIHALVTLPEGGLVVAGQRGTLLRWQGVSWEQLPAPTKEDLLLAALHGNELWVAGGRAGLFRWEGGGWREEALPFEPLALAGGARGIWVGGAGREHLLRLGPGGRRVQSLGVELEASHGASAGPGAAWLAGDEALFRIEADGTKTSHPLPTADLRGLSGGADGVWAFGATGILRFDP